jgi:hypothetical protein
MVEAQAAVTEPIISHERYVILVVVIIGIVSLVLLSDGDPLSSWRYEYG